MNKPSQKCLTNDGKFVFSALQKTRIGDSPFVLSGGTAMAMWLEHRLSLDFDFAISGKSLPKPLINIILSELGEQGFRTESIYNDALYMQFVDSGLDGRDYQQQYALSHENMSEPVKLEFFTLSYNTSLNKQLHKDVHNIDGIKLASFDDLFKEKSMLIASRRTLRDYFDIYSCLKSQRKTIFDLSSTIVEHLGEFSRDQTFNELSAINKHPSDPGLTAVNLTEAETVEEMKRFFGIQVEQFRLEQFMELNDFSNQPRSNLTQFKPKL